MEADTRVHHTAPLYDAIAPFYDPWSVSVTEDVDFYVGQAHGVEGPVVELAVGTGRIAIPIAKAGHTVIGVDQSPEMLAVARAYADREGVGGAVELRVGDVRRPPVEGRFPLVVCPFRSLLHLADIHEKLDALHAAARLVEPGGRFVFDVFAPSAEDIAETDGRWLEREPGILERADWDEPTRTLTLSVKADADVVSFTLHWLSREEWEELLATAGFEVVALYGWFDQRPFDGGEDMIWVCRPLPHAGMG